MATVRRCTRACPRLLAHTERVLLQRAQDRPRDVLRLLSMIPAATNTSVFGCARPSAGMRPPEAVVRSESSTRVRCACVLYGRTV